MRHIKILLLLLLNINESIDKLLNDRDESIDKSLNDRDENINKLLNDRNENINKSIDERTKFNIKCLCRSINVNCTDEEIFQSIDKCMKLCIKHFPVKLNIFDKMIGRTYEDKLCNICHYICVKSFNTTMGLKNIKRNGRWAFMSILGFTEIFSSIIALIGFIYNVYIYNVKVKHTVIFSPFYFNIYLHYISMSLAFLSAFMFHLHETPFTRNLDYFTAVHSVIMYTLNSIIRAFNNLIPITPYLTCFSIIIFMCHVYYMMFINFDLLFHKRLCGLFYILSLLSYLFVFYCLRRDFNIKHKNRKRLKLLYIQIRSKMITFSILSLISVIFEISDIPPFVYLVDSHALWHIGLFCIIKPFHDYQILETKLHLANKTFINK